MLDPCAMAITESDATLGHVLHVDHFGLSIGSASVGLPVSCTTDTVLRRYLDLVRLVEGRSSARVGFERDDLEVLASATHLPVDAVERRLEAIVA